MLWKKIRFQLKNDIWLLVLCFNGLLTSLFFFCAYIQPNKLGPSETENNLLCSDFHITTNY